MSEGGTIALVTQKVAKVNDPTSEDVYEIGTVAEIKQMVRLPDGTVRVVVEGKEEDEDPGVLCRDRLQYGQGRGAQ